MTATRRLAAILAADVVGYSRLMGEDEGAKTPRSRPTAFRSLTSSRREQWPLHVGERLFAGIQFDGVRRRIDVEPGHAARCVNRPRDA
jgi:class 3 adenylate cyclase